MKKGGDNSITRVRTFDEDIARAKGIDTPKGPTLIKEKETAQGVADKILDTQTRQATDFMANDKPEKEMLAPDIEVEVDIPAEEVLATHQKELTEKPIPVEPKVNKLVAAGLEEDIRTIRDHTKSVQTTEGAVYDVSNSDVGEGTLITNKKRKKHHLLPSVYSALTSWFTTTKTELTTPKKPEHTVSSAQSRIATITAAARESKHAPHNDHGVMVKRLTAQKKKPVAKAVKITKKEDAAAPQWSSATDGTEVEKETEVVTPVIIEEALPQEQIPEIVFKESAPVEEIEMDQAPLVIEPVHEVPNIPEAPEPIAPIIEAVAEVVAPVSARETQVEMTEPVVEIVEPVVEMIEPVVEKPVVKKEQKEVPRKKRTYKATPSATSGVSIYVYILVVVGASLLGIGVSVYWFMSATPVQETVIIRIPSLFEATTKVPVTLSGNSEDTLSTILDLSIATRETVQIYPATTDINGLQIPTDAQTTLSGLGFRAPGSFMRAVTDISFGSYNGTDPFILMKVTNFDTAFGGILEWEPDLSEDLTPLFGTPVTHSYDPYSRTDTQVRSAFFRDTVIANKSARLLVDAEDDQRLIYSFVQPNLILITTNSATFSAVLPLITP